MSPEEIEQLKSEITAEAKAEATQALGEVIHKTQVSSRCAVQRLYWYESFRGKKGHAITCEPPSVISEALSSILRLHLSAKKSPSPSTGKLLGASGPDPSNFYGASAHD